MNAKHDLTKNQSLVLDALSDAHGPLSAYTILDQLRDHGLRAPLQVYRALEKLLEFGLVHRLESLNAFVACRHPHCGEDSTMAFAICERCGTVTEFFDDALEKRLAKLAKSKRFRQHKTTIELRGLCESCAAL